MKLGVFGGSFNPIHKGHLNSLNSLQVKLQFDRLVVIPTGQNPLSYPIEGASCQQCLEMVQIALRNFSVEVDTCEIEKKGVSFTIDTLRQYSQRYPAWDIYLIVGLDQLECFHLWKEYREILKISHLVVTSRPGYEFPKKISDLSVGLQGFVQHYFKDKIQLTTSRSIIFHTLEDMDVSSTEIRENIRKGECVEKMLPSEVLDYIHQHQLYGSIEDKVPEFKILTQSVAYTLFDKNAIRVKAYDMSQLQAPTEFNLIASGQSPRHTKALSEYVIRGVKEEFDLYPQGIDGQLESQWIVLDYGSLMVHLFYDFIRWRYNLENLWHQGVDMEWVP